MITVSDVYFGLSPALLLYLDPGTGSLLFSVVMGFATASFFVLKGIFYKNRSRLLKIIGKQPTLAEHSQQLVIYSEGRQYVGTFRPILDALVKRGIACLYLSSDEHDPLLAYSAGLVCTKHIGKSYAAWGYLNTLKADICIMTTPGLDVLQIKRSKQVRHYAHIIHSPTDKAFNRPYSFDYFDSVFICGPHQKQTIRYLENLRHTASKQLFLSGCVYYDQLVHAHKEMSAAPRVTESLQVLIAPTWGKNGLLERYGMRLITPLAAAGFQVILRPHPQTAISEPELIAQIRNDTKHLTNITWDEASSPLQSMINSDILVSDISGIVFDYAFVTEKPVITLDFRPEKRGFEANDLPYEPWELRVLDLVGKKIKESEIEQIATIVQQEMANSSRHTQIRELRELYVVNFGSAAEDVVNEIDKLMSYRPQSQGVPDAKLLVSKV